jgi:hypothetical protein
MAGAVLQVIYLVFNEGYSAAAGAEVTRAELTGEAIRLGRLLTELRPEPEVIGLSCDPTQDARPAVHARGCRSLSWLFPAVGNEQARHLIVGGVCVGAQVVGDEDFS